MNHAVESQAPTAFKNFAASGFPNSNNQFQLPEVDSVLQTAYSEVNNKDYFDDARDALLKQRRNLSLKDLDLGVPVVPRKKLEISTFLVGEGGQALVKKGTFCGTKVAIKSFPKTKESYLAFREIILLDRVRHPNIILLMGVSEGLDSYHLIMEYYDNYSLQSVLFSPDVNNIYQLTESQKIHIAKQLCLALNFLHLEDDPIVHRDVKPSNVLVEWSDVRKILYNIKLCDLGMAKCQEISSVLKTSAGNCKVRGTEYYRAPEVIKRENPCPKSDVWSAGCTILELFTEESAWQFPETDIVKDEVKEAVMAGKSPKVDSAPAFIQEILCNMLKHTRDERCQISDVLEVLNNLIETTFYGTHFSV